ncbi:MAG: response regulator [Candidatus Aminicenantes bacterium]|nr:response regulator [Candidatus Aminicenantes bacterium]
MAEKESILIVDDSESTRRSLSLIFKKKGYETIAVETGREAISKVHERFFNVALLDIKLPDMEGIELIPLLKQMFPDIVIIMVTGHASLETAVQAMNEGASSYITKPLDIDEVLSTIEESLEKQHLVIENKRLLHELQRELAERRRIEEELRRHRDHLEEMVRERTAKLAEANFDLQREIVERKRAEEHTKASLREKELLLKEIHHRVNDNMQIISSMLSIQELQIKDEKAKKAFRESWNRIRSMALIHEKLYNSRDFSSIDFSEYVDSLLPDLFTTYAVSPDDINLKKNVSNVFLEINTAIPCGLIINELVSNSLKFAFPPGKKGEIVIDFISKNNTYVLTIGDNGKGFPDYLDFRKSEALGMQLVRLLCKKINGSISLDRSKGTVFKIVFKSDMDRG